jgi:dolichol-phosphate mannosyltransferase
MTSPGFSSVSVVIPAYNESEVIGTTIARVENSLGSYVHKLQIVVVSDGSRDRTFESAVESLTKGGGVVIDLVSNVGSHSAIRCGLRHATGDTVIVMAADGQDPPEVLPEMLDRFTPQVDIVWARREARIHDPFPRRVLSKLYYWLFRRLTGLDYPPGGFDFVAFRRRVATTLMDYRERNTSLFLLLFNLGYEQASIDYQRASRVAGQSSWTIRKRTKLAIDMITAFSAAPIRLISALGVVVGFGGLVYGAITIVRALIGNVPIEGWASLMVVASLMGGLTLVALGFLGEYVWRTLEEARQRPLYIESRVFNGSQHDR